MGIPSFLIKYCNASAPAYYDSIWFVTRTRHSRSNLLNRIFITRGRRTVYSSSAWLIKETVHPLPSHYNKNKHIIVNELSGTNIFITADHGFLYTYKPLSESDKIDRKAFSGNVYELGRRYALTAPDTTADFLLPVNLERELDGTPIKGYAPQDTIRMKVQGGGENYVHGGISLQELVVPVIAFKNLRTSNKNYVEVKNAELKLLSESRKISNLIFSLEFHQRQPVGDKIQPCTYSIYMTDDEGVVISDRQTVIADKTSDNAADRVFRVRFNLKAGTYDKKKVYRLVIANEIDVEEIEFHIDIAFADDFGFDL